jgi:hypothetical protein
MTELVLIDELVDKGGALSAALAVAQRFAEGPPLAFELMKGVFARGLEDMIQAEVDLQHSRAAGLVPDQFGVVEHGKGWRQLELLGGRQADLI